MFLITTGEVNYISVTAYSEVFMSKQTPSSLGYGAGILLCGGCVGAMWSSGDPGASQAWPPSPGDPAGDPSSM